jgi:hypothetical protein
MAILGKLEENERQEFLELFRWLYAGGAIYVSAPLCRAEVPWAVWQREFTYHLGKHYMGRAEAELGKPETPEQHLAAAQRALELIKEEIGDALQEQGVVGVREEGGRVGEAEEAQDESSGSQAR